MMFPCPSKAPLWPESSTMVHHLIFGYIYLHYSFKTVMCICSVLIQKETRAIMLITFFKQLHHVIVFEWWRSRFAMHMCTWNQSQIEVLQYNLHQKLACLLLMHTTVSVVNNKTKPSYSNAEASSLVNMAIHRISSVYWLPSILKGFLESVSAIFSSFTIRAKPFMQCTWSTMLILLPLVFFPQRTIWLLLSKTPIPF